MKSTVRKINTSIDLSKNRKVNGIFVLWKNSSCFNFSASYTRVFLKTLVCLSPWLLGHFRLETIAFSTGHSVACCVHALAMLTPLIRSAVHRFATLACLLCSLAPFTGSLTHFAHSLMGQLKFLNMCSHCRRVSQEQTRFCLLETRP